jgi:hypothetical protein
MLYCITAFLQTGHRLDLSYAGSYSNKACFYGGGYYYFDDGNCKIQAVYNHTLTYNCRECSRTIALDVHNDTGTNGQGEGRDANPKHVGHSNDSEMQHCLSLTEEEAGCSKLLYQGYTLYQVSEISSSKSL